MSKTVCYGDFCYEEKLFRETCYDDFCFAGEDEKSSSEDQIRLGFAMLATLVLAIGLVLSTGGDATNSLFFLK